MKGTCSRKSWPQANGHSSGCKVPTRESSKSHSVKAAVDYELRASDVGRVVAGQEQHHPGDVLGGALALKRHCGGEAVALLLGDYLDHLGHAKSRLTRLA